VSPTERTLNRALAPGKRGMALLMPWQIFRRSRCSPNRENLFTATVLTLERKRRKDSVRTK
jgi:hypothetical protein